MARERILNWKLLVVVLIGLAVFLGTGYGLHKWNRSNRAAKGLTDGQEAFSQSQWKEATYHLGIYIGNTPRTPEVIPVLLKHAHAQLNTRPLTKKSMSQSIESYRTIQRIENEFSVPPDKRSVAAEKLVEIYLIRKAPEEAELIAHRAMAINSTPLLRKLYAKSLVDQRKFQEGAIVYQALIEEFPEDIFAYEAMGKLTELRLEDFVLPPNQWFNQAVEKNPTSPLSHICRADYYYRHHDLDQAQADLKKAMSLDLSDEILIYLRLIKSLLQAKDLVNTEIYLIAAQKISPKNQKLWQFWALTALRSNDKEKQLAVAEQGLLALKNQRWDFLPSAIELYLSANEIDQAEKCLEQLREKKMFLPLTDYFSGRLAEIRGDYFQSLRDWNQALQLGLESPKLRLAMARIALKLGSNYEASQYLRKIIEDHPNHFKARLELAKLLFKSESWQEAEEHALVARQLEPDNLLASLLHLQSRVQRLVEKSVAFDSVLWQKISEEYLSLRLVFPESRELAIAQIKLEMGRHRYDQSQRLFDELKYKFPDDPEVDLTLIHMEMAQNNFSIAVKLLNQAIGRYEQSIVFDELLARLYFCHKEIEKSKTVLSQGIARVKNPLSKRQLQLQLVQCHQVLAETQAAYELLKRLTEEFPQDISIKSKYLRTSEVLSDHDLAQQLIEQIKDIEGLDGYRWHYEQAYYWFYQEDFITHGTQIIEHLKEVLVVNPTDSSAHLLLAKAYDRSGNVSLALMEYRNALNSAYDDPRIMAAYATLLYRTQDFVKGDAILDEAESLGIDHPILTRLELYRRIRLKDVDSAEKLLQDSIEKHPGEVELKLLLVRLEIEKNNYEKANQLLSEIRKKSPDSLEAIALIVDICLLQDDEEKALKYCEQFFKEREDAVAYSLRARTYARLNRLEDAIIDIEKTTAIEPDNVERWIEKSHFYVNLGQHENALIAIRKAMNVGEDSLRAKKYAIELLFLSNKPQDRQRGEAVLEAALQMAPHDIELRLVQARFLMTKNWAAALRQAESILTSITEQQPSSVEAWVLLGNLYLRQNDPGKAINVIITGLGNVPNDKSLLFLKSKAEAIHSPEIAMETLERIHELYPNDFGVVLGLADLYADNRQPEKTISFLKAEMIRYENPVFQNKARLLLIAMEHLKGNTAVAYGQLDEFKILYPNDYGLFLTYVDFFIKDQRFDELTEMALLRIKDEAGQHVLPLTVANRLASLSNTNARKKAENIFRDLLNKYPNDTAVLNDFGQFLHQAGRFSESAKVFESILVIDPQRITAANNLAWIYATELGNDSKALELAQKGLEVDPDYADLLDTRGVIYSHLGDYQNAVNDFEHCLSLYHYGHVSRAAVHFRLAKALLALNQTGQAKDRLEEALRIHRTRNTLTPPELQEVNHLLTQLR